MILIASDWLALAIILCIAAYFAKRRVVAFLLPVAVCIAAYAVYLPTGSPRLTAPPAAEYTVLGAKIVPNVGIWVLLDDGKGEPTYFRLPWSTAQGNALQQALDASQGTGRGPHVKIDGEGGQTYDGDPPVQGGAPKTAEQPQISLP